ncbi:MAG: hypothetical protein ACE5G7_05060 [Candidatus Hydrothermarchaeaceae archaeon]
MGDYSTRNWIIALLVAGWITTFVIGFLHESGMLSEPGNPIVHTFRDWIIVVVLLIPISLGLLRVIPSE